VTRIAEPPRITRPLTPTQWAEIDRAGEAIETKLQTQDVRLTMGGEPTFIAGTDRDAEEWNTAAVGPTKRHYADQLIRRLRDRFAPGGVLHYGQGKWYPGEPLPRWAFSLIWSGDGMPLWQNANLIAAEGAGTTPLSTLGGFSTSLADALGLDPEFAQPVYEDPAAFALQEGQLPDNVTPEDSKLDDPEERARLLRISEQGLASPVAYVIPIQLAQAKAHGHRRFKWASERWGTRRGKLYLMPGDSPAGFRLPLGSLQWLREEPQQFQRDPMVRRRRLETRAQVPWVWGEGGAMPPPDTQFVDVDSSDDWVDGQTAFWVEGQPIRTALTVEVRDGTLCVFLPPTGSVEQYLDLLEAVEDVATSQDLKIHVEGYEPPRDHRVNMIKVTPDPGVIEINIHPATSWAELREITATLYEEARQCGLDSFTFLVDGRLTGSGGGNHIVVGGASPADSPFLRRPDLLGSIIRYWQRHPSLSYLFSGLFIGPTSQAPRFDEGRPEAVYEMEIALKEMERLVAHGQAQPWLTDRLFRHLLTDMTGNTHRAEICIDKMFSPDGPTGRLGLVEFRGFEMPPHWQMSLAQGLVLRALIAWFWAEPYREEMEPWGTALHDRFLLEDYVWADFTQVLDDLSRAHGMAFRPEWFDAQREFRFARAGEMEVAGVQMALRNGIEPWLVLGEESTGGGTARYVDSSVERLQMRTQGLDPDRYTVTCNGIALPLQDRGAGAHVAGIRFRSWQPWSALHPTVPAHGPLVFDLFDRHAGRSVGGCTYRVAHQGGRAHETRPINHLEAEGRALARFEAGGHSAHLTAPQHLGVHPAYPVTLDMRRL
ncbi:MAG: transglutaminase family protein, partial [Pseudomonadota bacterium]